MTQRQCAHCAFMVSEEKNRFCRRYPPAAHIVVMPVQHPISGQVSAQPQTMSSFPPVQATQWCGEFVERKAEIALQ